MKRSEGTGWDSGLDILNGTGLIRRVGLHCRTTWDEDCEGESCTARFEALVTTTGFKAQDPPQGSPGPFPWAFLLHSGSSRLVVAKTTPNSSNNLHSLRSSLSLDSCKIRIQSAKTRLLAAQTLRQASSQGRLTRALPYSVACPAVSAVLTAGDGPCALAVRMSRHPAASPSQRLGILEGAACGCLRLPIQWPAKGVPLGYGEVLQAPALQAHA